MNREDIIRMAREAGFCTLLPSEHIDGTGGIYVGDDDITDSLKRFAALVAAAERKRLETTAWGASKKWIVEAVAAEREACAKVADLVAREIDDTNGTATYIAAAIRARGEPEQEPVKRTVMYRPADLEALGLTHRDVVKLVKENT